MTDSDRRGNALFDGDEILYKACRVCETETTVTGELTIHSDPAQIRRIIRQEVQFILDETDSIEAEFAFSDPEENYRKSVYGAYKTNRVAARKPLGYYKARAWVEKNWHSITWPTCEADDVMGALGEQYNIVVSSDKDMLTVPGIYYSPYHRKIRSATTRQANYFFLVQTLTGDATDGYPGCAKVGPVKAARILEEFCTEPGKIRDEDMADAWHNGVLPAYAKAKPKRDPLVQARCARILRPGEASLNHVDLWEAPPKPTVTNDEPR